MNFLNDPAVYLQLTALVNTLTSLVVTWAVKRYGPSAPGWVFPLVSMVVSLAATIAETAVSGHPSNWVIAFACGLAATGLHQAQKQLKEPNP